MSDTNKERMEHITDRACYNVVASFPVEYRLQGVNLSLRTISARVKKNIQAEIERNFSNHNSVPYMYVNDIIFSIEDINDDIESDTCLCRTKFDIDLTFEETDNTPEPLANQLIRFLFSRIITPKVYNNITGEVNIVAPEKGYIQSDRTIYFPSHE
jgi:hypothetical protein